MNSSRAFKWTVGLLLPLTLAWKIVVGPDDPNEFTKRIENFLARQGFNVVTTEEVMGNMQVINATKGECRMFVVERSGKGWTRELIRSEAEPTDQSFIVFRGEIYKDEPTWLTATTEMYFRSLRRLGLGRLALVVGANANSACNVADIPWDKL